MFVRWIKSAQTSRTLMPGVWQSYANLPSINDVFYLVGFVDLLFKAGERHFASVRLLVIGVRQCGLLHLETKRKTNDILDGVNARVRGGGKRKRHWFLENKKYVQLKTFKTGLEMYASRLVGGRETGWRRFPDKCSARTRDENAYWDKYRPRCVFKFIFIYLKKSVVAGVGGGVRARGQECVASRTYAISGDTSGACDWRRSRQLGFFFRSSRPYSSYRAALALRRRPPMELLTRAHTYTNILGSSVA